VLIGSLGGSSDILEFKQGSLLFDGVPFDWEQPESKSTWQTIRLDLTDDALAVLEVKSDLGEPKKATTQRSGLFTATGSPFVFGQSTLVQGHGFRGHIHDVVVLEKRKDHDHDLVEMDMERITWDGSIEDVHGQVMGKIQGSFRVRRA
jgi:hypothetical protein